MKKILTAAICLFCILSAVSAPITPEDALSRIKTDGPMRIVSDIQPELRFTESLDGRNCLYVFSKGDDNGFIIASADDSSAPILGYSDSGSLPMSREELPASMQSTLQRLADEVAANAKAGSSAGESLVCGSTPTEFHNIETMIQTQWGKYYPYDSLFPHPWPEIKMRPSPCTLAIAQILKYFNYPEIGKGIVTLDFREAGEIETFDFSQTRFDWDHMLPRYDGSESEDEINAVAQLLRGCSIGLNAYDIGYRDNLTFLAKMLVENLDYDKGIRVEYRDSHDANSWNEVIFTALKDGSPVIMTPAGILFNDAFICDGYRDGYFHINWCYDGIGDGYYLLSALNPDVPHDVKTYPDTRASSYQAIIGIKPNQGSDNYIRQVDLFNTPGISFRKVKEDGVYKLVDMQVSLSDLMVQCYPDADITLGIRATSLADGNTYEAYSTESQHIAGYYPVFDFNFATDAFNDLEEGSYLLTPICRAAGVEQPFECKVLNTDYGNSFLQMGTSPEGHKTASITPYGENIIRVTDFKLEDPLYKDNLLRVSATLTNTSSDHAFFGYIYSHLRADESTKDIPYMTNGDPVPVFLEPGESRKWEYTSEIYTLVDNKDIFVPCEVKVCLMSSFAKYNHIGQWLTDWITTEFTRCEQAALSIDNLNIDDNQNCWNVKATATLRVPSGYFSGILPLKIYDKESGELAGTFYTGYVHADARNSAEPITIPLEWNFLFNNGVDGKSYLAHVWPDTYENAISNEEEFTAGIGTGVSNNIADNTAYPIRTEYYTITGARVDRPGNGIYIVRHIMSDGSSKTTKSIIK